ncbi:MAG: SulP family inorganic anion transporter [Gemmataceae bacterium]
MTPPRYSWRAFSADLVAGLTVAAVAVPQAMAYALIAGLEPRYGLYTAIVMTALASVFGSSRHLINGPTNAISLVVFGAVDGLTRDPGAPAAIELVGLLAVLTGLIQILIAVLKLGDLTRYVSEAVVLGFMAGAGLLVALSQVPGLLGLKAQGAGHDHFLYRLWLTFQHGGVIDPRAVAVSLTTLLLVFGFHRLGRRLRTRVPTKLLTLIPARRAPGRPASGRPTTATRSRKACRVLAAARLPGPGPRPLGRGAGDRPAGAGRGAGDRRARWPPPPASRSTTTASARRGRQPRRRVLPVHARLGLP